MIELEVISGTRYLGLVLFFIAAACVACMNRGPARSDIYERSRWLIFTATMLLGVHNAVQFLGHYREQSPTLCWTINLAFYVVITPLYNLGELNLLRAGRNMLKRYIDNAIFVALCYALFAVGYYTDTLINDDTPCLTVTFAVAVCYFLKIFELSKVLHDDMQTADMHLNDEELEERHQALRYTAKSMNWVIVFSLFTPWAGITSSLWVNSIFGLVGFVLLLWFIYRFLAFGSNMMELIDVTEEITVAEMIAEEEKQQQTDQPAEAEMADAFNIYQQRIEQWVSERHFIDPSVTISLAIKQMDVSVSILNLYLKENTPVTNYRKWLAYLRIEEAKRYILAHPDHSLDAVAKACGYANSSNFSRAFKGQEGMTPGQWLSKEKEQ